MLECIHMREEVYIGKENYTFNDNNPSKYKNTLMLECIHIMEGVYIGKENYLYNNL